MSVEVTKRAQCFKKAAMLMVVGAAFIIGAEAPPTEVHAQLITNQNHITDTQDLLARQKLLIVPGFNNTPRENWFLQIRSDLAQSNIDAEIVDIPPRDIPNRKEHIKIVMDAIRNIPGKICLVGISLGGGTIQMILDDNDFESELKTENGENKIEEVILYESRNLYRLDRSKIPDKFRDFYVELSNPAKAQSRVDRIKVVTGGKDVNVLPENSQGLAAAFKTEAIILRDFDHGEILNNPEMFVATIKS